MSPSERTDVDPDAAVTTEQSNGNGNGDAVPPAAERASSSPRRPSSTDTGRRSGVAPTRSTSAVPAPTSGSSSRVARPADLAPPNPDGGASPATPAPGQRDLPAEPAARPIPAIVPATPDAPADEPGALVPTEAAPRPPTLLSPTTLVPPTPDWTRPTEPPAGSRMTSHSVAPVPRVMGRRPRVRKVTRVVRHVDPWTVFKVAGVFSLVVYVVALTAGVLLWNVAYATGTVDNLERFFESFGWTEFEFNGGEIYHNAWIAGLFGAVGLTGAAVLGATLFNLITDLVGGLRFTVLEEEVVERTTAPMRRFVVRRPTGEPHPGSQVEVAHPPSPPDATSR